MKKLLLVFTALISTFAMAGDLVIVGNIPAMYLTKAQVGKKKYSLGYITIQDRVITELDVIKSQAQLNAVIKESEDAGFEVVLARYSTPSKYSAKAFDFLYPGFIDLHNHTKQNTLGVWDLAKGQFMNRFEWRKWSNYKYSVSGNMNPWVGYGKPIECASFRWSELQAMVVGTTYLQGPSGCIADFAIHQVEDPSSYISKKKKIQAPTDLVMPGEMTFVWDELKPAIDKGKSYEAALAAYINKKCDIPGITAGSVGSREGLKKLKDQKLLKAKCKAPYHPKFIRYTYWIHGSIMGKKKYLKDPKRGALIAHLAEGRREDKYNMVEYELVKLLGLDQKYVNFVHGVGIKPKYFKEMGKKGMGLIWSPYSNLLLYGETLDILAAKKAGITMSIGSDWLPTGSRGILEEIKLAAKYVEKDFDNQGLKKVFTNQELFKMMTEYPAKMINHWEINEAKGEHGIGQLKIGAMGTVVALRKYVEDPYLNVVKKAFVKDVNLVVVDGNPVYGNEKYIKQVGYKSTEYETLPKYYKGLNKHADTDTFPVLEEKGSTKATKYAHLVELGQQVAEMKLVGANNCRFRTKKAFVHQDSLGNKKNKGLKEFYEETGLNLDRANDIQKILAVGMLTQSRNRNNSSKGKESFRVTEFDPLYSCHNKYYMDRLFDFVVPDSADEFEENRANADELRAEQRLGRTPKKMAEDYGQ